MGLMDIETHRHCDNMRTFKPDKNPSTEKENGHKVLFLTKKLSLVDSYWERGKLFSPKEWH